MSSAQRMKSQQLVKATWLFVGATFVLVGATVSASAGNRWLQYSGMVIGLIIMICGFVVLFRKRPADRER